MRCQREKEHLADPIIQGELQKDLFYQKHILMWVHYIRDYEYQQSKNPNREVSTVWKENNTQGFFLKEDNQSAN